MMFDDIVKSIKASLYERSTSPLFGAVSVSWLLWNHRLIVVLFSSMSVDEKFRYIDTVLYGDPINRWAWWVIGPVTTAVIFLFVYPYPAKWVFRFWRNRHKELKDIRQKIEDETPLTLEEARRVRRQLVDLRIDYELEIKQNADEISQLKEGLATVKEADGHAQTQILTLTNQVMQAEERERDLKNKVEMTEIFRTAQDSRKGPSDDEVEEAILAMPYVLQFNPQFASKQKTMTFRVDGVIVHGKNENENSWAIKKGQLELVQADGKVHSRFNYDPASRVFTHTGDKDTLSVKGQYMLPEPQRP